MHIYTRIYIPRMLIAALLIRVKTWKQPKCLSIEMRINKHEIAMRQNTIQP